MKQLLGGEATESATDIITDQIPMLLILQVTRKVADCEGEGKQSTTNATGGQKTLVRQILQAMRMTMQQREAAENIIDIISDLIMLTQGPQILISRGMIGGANLWESHRMMIMNKLASNQSIRDMVTITITITITIIITNIGTMPSMMRKVGLFRIRPNQMENQWREAETQLLTLRLPTVVIILNDMNSFISPFIIGKGPVKLEPDDIFVICSLIYYFDAVSQEVTPSHEFLLFLKNTNHSLWFCISHSLHDLAWSCI